MPIPQSQLETWSHQGSVTQSKNTYATIKAALESVDANIRAATSRCSCKVLTGTIQIFMLRAMYIVIRQDASFYYELHDVPTSRKTPSTRVSPRAAITLTAYSSLT